MLERLRRILDRWWPGGRRRDIDDEIATHLAMAVRDVLLQSWKEMRRV